jgi:hypothetical protein
MLHNFNTNRSAILQAITMTSLPDIGNILITIFYWFHSLLFNGKLSVEQIWQTTLKQFFFTNNGWHDDVLRTLINHSVFSRALKKMYFKKIILQKLLYNTRPLGPLLPRQYYSTRSASSSHKISGSAVKAILTDFYCKILLSNLTVNVLLYLPLRLKCYFMLS